MSQQRHDHQLSLAGSEQGETHVRCYFLELPENIRRKIYLHAGLPTKQTFSFNGTMWPERQMFKDNIRGIDTGIPLGLMASCQALYEEMTRILYGENVMIITRSAPGGLRSYNLLTKTSLASLKILIIKLNVCVSDGGCTEFFDESYYGGCTVDEADRDTPLAENMYGFSLMANWSIQCARLGEVMKPGALSLHVWCDCKTLGIAKMIVAPLLRLPLLKDCTLRLAHRIDPAIRQLALVTVNRITGSSGSSKQGLSHDTPTPEIKFLYLPVEVQQKILSYAVHQKSYDETIEIRNNKVKCGEYCTLKHCYVLQDGGDMGEIAICVCERQHSAASNSRCRCAETGPPLAMFLVSKKFRELAMRAFYGDNTFKITGQSIFKNIDVTKFPNDALKFLKYLIIEIPEPITTAIPRGGFSTTVWNEWRNTVDKLIKHGNLANLHLEIKFADAYDNDDPEFMRYGPPPTPRPSVAYMARVREFYKKLVKLALPLGKGGLKSFVVYLVRTQDYRPYGEIDDEEEEEFENGPKAEARVELETELERMVMGSNWDAFMSGGKKKRNYFNW